jgi:hypothetical protein
VDKAWPWVRFVFEVCVVASSYPEEGQSASDDGEGRRQLPFRAGGETGHSAHTEAHTEARAELRDRETYYAELRFAVHLQSRSTGAIPAPRAVLDDLGADTWTHADRGNTRSGESPDPTSGTAGESWAEIIARFDDTWT